MSYKIIALDIDGTVTNSDKKITQKTKDALLRIQKQGIKVVLATGRPTPGVSEFAKELQLWKYGGYILSFNGAKVVNCATKEVVYQMVLPKEQIPSLYEEAEKNNVGFITYEGNNIVCGTELDRYIELEARMNGMEVRQVDNFINYVNFPVNKCLMTGEGEKLAILEQKLKEKYGTYVNIFRSEPFFLEIMPPSIDKAYSLSKLLEKEQISREEMVAVGDGYNDRSMISYAGLGVAMANAQKEVKDCADFITTSNNEDGVAKVIEAFIEGR